MRHDDRAMSVCNNEFPCPGSYRDPLPGLEEIDPKLWLERHDRFFPAFCLSLFETMPTLLAWTLLDSHLFDFDFEKIFHGRADLCLVRQHVDFKGVLVVVGAPSPSR